MSRSILNSFSTESQLEVGGVKYHFHSLKRLRESHFKNINRLPFSLRILLENLLRHEDGVSVKKGDIEALANWDSKAKPNKEIRYMPARILLQDFTGVPAVCDLAAMRGAMKRMGGDPEKVNPHQPADLVIDHSVQVDHFGSAEAAKKNTGIEFQRNQERYQFLRWGQSAFKNFRVVPPSTGIVHQVNLEFLSKVAFSNEVNGNKWVYPDTLVGTDSHTTMINGLGVLGWGVGGIEAEAAMLGQPISMLIPNVVGFKMTGQLPAGATATDLVLVVVEMLRKKGVVGKFVEFFGKGLSSLTLADRATIANMGPEYGATIGIFPVDDQTTQYLELTARPELVPLVKDYYQAQELWYNSEWSEPEYSDVLELDLSTVEPSLAGPSRPQDRQPLSRISHAFKETLPSLLQKGQPTDGQDKGIAIKDPSGQSYEIENGSTVIAAITSCTNTSNPSVMVGAGLVAKKAIEKGLTVKPWVKTSLAPGSKVVTNYLKESGLLTYLEKLNFHVVGYGCTTCIGNSGPLPEHIVEGIEKGSLVVSSVLSGNRNFEGRISPHVRANYLASPPLVVAYALAGNININLTEDPIGQSKDGTDIFLKDIWPTDQEISEIIQNTVTSKIFQEDYSDVFTGEQSWQNINIPKGELYDWDEKSTYIKEPPFFKTMTSEPDPVGNIKNARVLALLKDSVTTDHISPAGSIQKSSPAGQYLVEKGVDPKNFNSFGSRRGNHEVMLRGTFGNVRLKNQLAPGTEGGFTKYLPDGADSEPLSIYEASMRYQQEKTPLIVIAGKEYGTGSSRDWAAKGSLLLGIHAVIAESFERIHRSNLVGMGVLPLQFLDGESCVSHGLTGHEQFDIEGIETLAPGKEITVLAKSDDGEKKFSVIARVDTPNEVEYYTNGGILPYVLRQSLRS